MCNLTPSPKGQGYFLGQCVLVLDSDFLLASGKIGASALAGAYLSKEVRGEVRKRHVKVKSFRKVKLCVAAEDMVRLHIAQGAAGDAAHPEAHMTTTDWSLVVATSCISRKRAANKSRRGLPSPVLATGEKAIVSVAVRIFGLQAQVLVSAQDPRRFWYLISDGPGTIEVNTAIGCRALPFRIP